MNSPRPQRSSPPRTLTLLLAPLALLLIALAGCGTNLDVHAIAQAQNRAEVSPISLTWGKTAVGESGSAQTATLTNTGHKAVHVTGVALSGADAGDFAIQQQSCGATLTRSKSCAVSVVFKPTASGTRTANLTFTDSSSNGPQQVSLSGIGASAGDPGGSVAVSPTSLSWYKVEIGNAGGPKTATLTNDSGASINISNIEFTGTNSGDFAIYRQTCGSTLAAAASCTVTVLFKPTASGTRTATLNFIDSAGNSPQQVALTGLGEGGATGSVTVSPGSLAFGSVSIGGTSASQTLTLTNSTAATVNLTGAGISGANAADFAISSTTCGATLAASASCATEIAFKPTAVGARSAAWTVSDGSGTLSAALSGTGAASTGTADVSPTSLSWYKVNVGQAGGPKTATLTNNTGASISISNIGFAGANPGDFAIYRQTCGSTLAASASCTVTVLFKPTVSGTRTATLNFTDGAGNSPQQVSLTGLGTGGPTGSVTAAPASLDFGSVTQGSASAGQAITVTNSTSASVTLGSPTITGADAADFTVSSTTCGPNLAASATCTANVVFTPATSGGLSASWTITSSDSATPLTVALSGTGASNAGLLDISPTSESWWKVHVGQASGSRVVTLTNNSSADISITGIAFTGTDSGDFQISQKTCGATLAASKSCTVTLLFTPTDSGTRTATLNFTDSASNSPQQLPVSGLGEDNPAGSITATPSSLDFGSVGQGSASASKTITITNNLSWTVTLSAEGISGADAADFAISNTNCAATLAASASCTASISFKPTAAGSLAAVWNITSSSSATPLSVALSGDSVAPSNITLTASPASLTWGKVEFGHTSASKPVTLTNNSAATVGVQSVTITGAEAGDFFVGTTDCGAGLAAGATCSATIFFAPKGTGTRTATLNFNDAASNAPQTVSLSGTATASTSGTVTVEPPRLSFPQTVIGQTSASMTATLMNGSTGTINLSGSTIQGAQASEFTQASTTCGATLAPSSSCTVDVTFTPAAAGTRNATLSFANSASSSPQTVILVGVGSNTAAGTAAVSPSSLVFGNFEVGTTSGFQQVFLKNTGTSEISFNSDAISGANAGDFFVTSKTCGATIAPSQDCNFRVIFSPTALGPRNATLTITDSATNSPQLVSLSGNGTPPPTATITITPSSLSWGPQTIGRPSATQTFTLTSGGTGAVSFSSIGFTGTNPGDFSITANTCGTTLAQGSSCTISVAFTPSAIGNRVALFSVADNAIASPQTAEVSGAGAYSTGQTPSVTVDFASRNGSQVAIPAGILGTEYLESLPTNANRETVVQGGFTTARYRLNMASIFTSSDTPNWGGLDYDIGRIAAAGVHPLVEVVNTPAFLQPSPLFCPADPPTNAPTDVDEWGKLAAAVVAHLDQKFPGLVTKYEIWNEPDTAAFCTWNQYDDYVRLYAAAAPLMKQQAQADGVSIMIGGPATSSAEWASLLTNPATAPYMDFYSYHFYPGSADDIKNGMTWDGAGGTPSLFQKVMNPTTGVQALFLRAEQGVQAAKTPMGAKTPIYFDEYNDDWAFQNDCCRNDPTFSPLFNSVTVAQLLNSVYKGATQVPSMMIYYAAGQRTFCILGILDTNMDCAKAATGAQAQPYPQWYAYRMMFNPSYLDLQSGGHMATSITLSSAASSAGLIATGWYTATQDSILLINPTSTSFSGITIQVNNPGLSAPTATLFTINAANPRASQWPATIIPASGGTQATFDLPPNSVLALSLK